MKRSILQLAGMACLLSFSTGLAMADMQTATAVLNAPTVSIGGNSDFEWGPIVSQTEMSLQGASDVHYPQKFAGGAIHATGGSAGNNTYCQSGPDSDGKEYFCGLVPAPDYPHINFSDYRQLAQSQGNNCAGQSCLNPTNLSSIQDPVCTVDGHPKVWFFDGSPAFGGQTYFCGVLVTLGSVKFTGGGTGTITKLPPTDAWKQYQVGTPAGGPDTSASNQYPGDSGFQSSNNPYTLTGITFNGYIYTTNGYSASGGTTILGAVQFGSGASSSQGGASIYFSSQIVIVEPPANKVDQPIITPLGGCYGGPVRVTIIDGTAGAAIYYTLDGSTPDQNSTLYTGSFTLPFTPGTDVTVKAIAIKAGMTTSELATPALFTFSSSCGGSGGNTAPVVNAGPDQSIALSASANLTGSATDDGRPNPPASLTYSWIQVSGPGTVTFGNATTPVTTASFSQVGTYVLRLTASDSQLSGHDDVQIIVQTGGPTNLAPVVQAGADQSISLPGSASLSGSATDDGLPNPPASLTFNWSQVSGPGTASFVDLSKPVTTVDFSQAGTYVLRLTASDSQLSGSDDIQITVQSAPPPPLTVQFSLPNYSANAGDGFALITVTRSGTGVQSKVDFATVSGGTAIAGKDYLQVSGTLVFGTSDASLTFDVPLLNGNDSGGTVLLALSNPQVATLGSPNTATLTISGQNPPPPPPSSPNPFISELVPYTAPVDQPSSFPMRVLGSNFDAAAAQVLWNNNIPLTVVSRSASEIVVTVDPSIWSNTPGFYPIIVRNPGPVDSNPATFTVRSIGNGTLPPFILNDASANPNPTYTKTTTLSVLGGTFSPGGESVLTYTWILVGLNPSSAVTFSNNGTHAGSTSIASFPTAGTYHLVVRVLDTYTQWAVYSSPLDVVVVRNATQITVTPKQQSIAVNAPLNLAATISDQWGVAMKDLAPTWTTSAGSLAASGLSASFSVNDVSIRQAVVTASVTNALNMSLSDQAMVTIIVSGAGGGPGGDITNAKAYPVPFKGNSGDPGITFSGLAPGTRIRLFTTRGRLVQTLDSPDGSNVLWDIRNANLDRVSSGVYMYVIEGAGQKKEGKLVVIQ